MAVAWALLCSPLLLCASARAAPALEPWRNVSLPTRARVADLLGRLSFAEKCAQLETSHDPAGQPGYLARFGLAEYTTAECLHGYDAAAYANTTVFPQAVTLAASFNATLLRAVGDAIAVEARALRNHFDATAQLPNRTLRAPGLTCFSPQINIARDPRWGRAQETYGEDPVLTGTLAAAYIAGMQGDHPTYAKAAATPKHFSAYGGATSRGHRSPTEVRVSWRDWQETFLPAFRAAIDPPSPARGAMSAMCSYNTLCLTDSAYNATCAAPSHGTPACADPSLLGGAGVLRGEWGFTGYVVGDAGAIKFVQTDHEFAASQPEAAAAALGAGADLALGGGVDGATGRPESFGALAEAAARGLVSNASIDTAVSRVLAARFRLGFMDPPGLNPYEAIPFGAANSAPHRSLARDAARQGMVLLQNRNGALPLGGGSRRRHPPLTASPPSPLSASSASLRLAVVGPNADAVQYGNYAGSNDAPVTALAGLRARAHATGRPSSLLYARGCAVTGDDRSGFANASAAAAAADVTVAVLGIDQSQEHETGTRAAIELPGVQEELLALLRAATSARGAPLVLVLVGGSAMAVPAAAALADAVLWMGYGGEEAGTALADVLYGDANPAGRSPFTWPAATAQLPPFGDYDMRGGPAGRTYRYLETSVAPPLWRFGDGLSYSRFATSNLTLARKGAEPVVVGGGGGGVCATVRASVTVTNVGDRDGEEVTMVWVSLAGTRSAAPRVAMRGFRRTFLRAGTSAAVSFALAPADFAVVDAADGSGGEGRGWKVQPCEVTVSVGGRQPSAQAPPGDDVQVAQLTLAGQEKPLAECR